MFLLRSRGSGRAAQQRHVGAPGEAAELRDLRGDGAAQQGEGGSWAGMIHQ